MRPGLEARGGVRGGRPLPPRTGVGQGAAGQGGSRRAPLPRAGLGDPAWPARRLGNRGAGQSAASCGLLGRALVVVQRGREFKVGLGARARLRGVAVRARGRGGGTRGAHLPTLHVLFAFSFLFPLFPCSRMRGTQEVAGNTCFANSGRPINVTD